MVCNQLIRRADKLVWVGSGEGDNHNVLILNLRCAPPKWVFPLLLLKGLFALQLSHGGQAPVVLGHAPHDGSLLQLDSAALLSVSMNTNTGAVLQQVSADDGKTWDPVAGGEAAWATKVTQDLAGQLHAVWLVPRGSGSRPAVDRFIDIWYAKTAGSDHQWARAHRIWAGYVGAIEGRLTQLRSGRIILPFARWLPEEKRGAPHGCNASTVIYTDDGGATWQESAARLMSLCPENYNGDPVGAVEPVVIELKDGRVWMLLRTQAGVLYESFSEDGVEWSPAQPTGFISSTGPAELARLSDGRIVLFWNMAEMPTRHKGKGVYGGRDALHAAISSDEGKTWRGFREVYLDPTRHQSPPKRGDRGTAYPQFKYMDGALMRVVSGQGATLRVMIAIDPNWLEETSRADDFTAGLKNWCVFKPFGEAESWWRDRAQGCALVPHPMQPGGQLLHLRKPDELDADGAIWNFPASRAGVVEISFQINSGFKGATFALCDRFVNPTDERGDLAAVAIALDADGLLNQQRKVSPGKFHKLQIRWDDKNARANLYLDGENAGWVKVRGKNPFGLCYLWLRSTATTTDVAGFYVESVKAETHKP